MSLKNDKKIIMKVRKISTKCTTLCWMKNYLLCDKFLASIEKSYHQNTTDSTMTEIECQFFGFLCWDLAVVRVHCCFLNDFRKVLNFVVGNIFEILKFKI